MKIQIIALLGCAILLTNCGSGGKGESTEKSSQGGADNKEKKDAGKDSKNPGQGDSQNMKLDGDSQKRANLQFQTVTARSIAGTLYASGRIALNDERTAHVGVITDGRITNLIARVGDPVRKGQVLGRFHSHDVHEAVAAYQIALADAQRRKNAVAYAQLQRDRYSRLFEIKSASRQEAEQSEAALLSAETDLKDAQINLEKERVHLTEFLQIPIGPDGRVDEAHENVPITSPINGVVIARPLTLGAVAAAGTEAYTIADLSSVWMVASVNESDTGKVRIGLPAEVGVESFPGITFHGSVTYLGGELDPTTRTLQVRVLVNNPAQKLRPEMYANAKFPEPQTRVAMFLPEDALQDINGNTIVFVRKNGDEFEARPVKLGKHDAGEVEVLAGLKAGDLAVVKGGFLLKSQMLRSTLEGG